MLRNEKQKDWSALAIQQIMLNLGISPFKLDNSGGIIYLILTEEDTTEFVNTLKELDSVEFLSSQNELLIPLCLPDGIIEQFIKIEESELQKTNRHKIEYQNRLLFFLRNMFGFKMVTGLRTDLLKKTFKLRRGNDSIVCIDCFNKAEAEFLKENLASYGFAVETAKCDACSLVVNLNESHVSKVSKLVIEFYEKLNDAGMDELAGAIKNNYAGLRVQES